MTGTATTAPALSERQRLAAFGAVACATVVAATDAIAISVALPAIAADFGAAAAATTWVVAAPQIVIVTMLLLFATVADSRGHRRVFIASLGLVLLATPLCILAGSLQELVLARILQSFGVAGIMAINFALLRRIFPPANLGRAAGMVATVVAIAFTLGPALAGLLLAVGSWRLVFVALMPLVAIALLAGWRWLPPDTPASAPVNPLSLVASMVLPAGLLVALGALAHGWPAAWGLAGLGLAAVGAGLLVAAQRVPGRKVFPVDLLAIPAFGLSILASVCIFTAQFLSFIVLPFHLSLTLGFDAVTTGLVLCAWPAAVACVAPFTGRLSDRVSAGPLELSGLTLFAVGLTLLAFLPDDAGPLEVAARMALCGAGFAGFQSPNNRVMMLSVPPERGGAGGGTMASARQFGMAAGTTLAALVLSMAGAGPDGLGAEASTVPGLRLPMTVAVCLILAGMAALILRRRAMARGW